MSARSRFYFQIRADDETLSVLEEKIAAAMVEAFKVHDVKSKALILNVDSRGAQILKR